MSKLFLIPALLLLALVNCRGAENYSTQWQKATTFYSQKAYDSAAAYLEQIAALKPANAEVFYNLGNTYYRLNKIAPAVLNYERALRLKPEYKDAKDNLALTQGRISTHIHHAGDIFFLDWWHNVTRPDKATMWAVLTLIAFCLIICTMLVRRFGKKVVRLPVQLTGIFAFLFLCLLVLAYTAADKSVNHGSAVVMVTDAPLMNKEQKGKPLALVPDGITVKIRSEQGSWAEVTLPDGRAGWLQLSAIEKI